MILVDHVALGARLRDVDVAIEAGQVVVVVGENGAGKSSLLDVIAGVEAPSGGRVLIDGVPLAALPARERARRIASVGATDPDADDVVAAARIAHGLAPRRGSRALLDGEARARVEAVAAELAVSHLLERPLGALSSGERRRVHVARALVDDEAVAFVLDEPHTAVDVRHQRLVSDALRRRAQAGKTVVLSTHDLGIAASLGDRALGLREGRLVVDCAAAHLLEPPRLEELYGIAQLRVVTVGC